jgi:hypothetical protein
MAMESWARWGNEAMVLHLVMAMVYPSALCSPRMDPTTQSDRWWLAEALARYVMVVLAFAALLVCGSFRDCGCALRTTKNFWTSGVDCEQR